MNVDGGLLGRKSEVIICLVCREVRLTMSLFTVEFFGRMVLSIVRDWTSCALQRRSVFMVGGERSGSTGVNVVSKGI